MGISEEAMKWLEKRERQLPKIRLDYDPIKNLSVIHEMAHRGFSSMFTKHTRGQLQAITRQHLTSTEAGADDSFKHRCKGIDPCWLIIEVGASERINQLRKDAPVKYVVFVS
jgi:hypothetical protein